MTGAAVSSRVAERPLEGLRVIDAGTRIGAPFCAGLLGEWGAEVIKVEQPGRGDFMREIGPFVSAGNGSGGAAGNGSGGAAGNGSGGYSLFWAVEGRGRKSATADLRRPEGQALFRRLAEQSDVVCENFRPGTMESWSIGPADLPSHLVYVRISAFGQDGPYASRPGLDRLGIAYGGLMHLTGEADRPPVRPGVTVADYLTGVFAAEAALAALYRRDASRTGSGAPSGDPPHFQDRAQGSAASGKRRSGRGAVIDASLYGSVLRILEWTIAAHDKLGTVRGREGNRLANSAPLDNYPSADGRYVCIVAGSDANFARLCKAMNRPDLAADARFSSLAERARHGDVINAIVAGWTAEHSASEIEAACIENDVPVATAYSAADIMSDPHMRARGDIVTVEDPVAGALRQQAPYPRLSGSTPQAPKGAPLLGEHNAEVWCNLVGLTREELSDLERKGIV